MIAVIFFLYFHVNVFKAWNGHKNIQMIHDHLFGLSFEIVPICLKSSGSSMWFNLEIVLFGFHNNPCQISLIKPNHQHNATAQVCSTLSDTLQGVFPQCQRNESMGCSKIRPITWKNP